METLFENIKLVVLKKRDLEHKQKSKSIQKELFAFCNIDTSNILRLLHFRPKKWYEQPFILKTFRLKKTLD